MPKILIDAGHYTGYGKSPVVTTPRYYEGNMTWELHGYLKNELEEYGITVDTTRKNAKYDISVYARGKMAKGYDMFISLHSNSPGGKADNTASGSIDRPVIIVPLKHSGELEAFAGKIGTLVHTLLDTKQITRGKPYQIYTKQHPSYPDRDYYGVIRGAVDAGCKNAIIIEHSFHTCPKTVKWLLQSSNLKKLAEAEAKIIAEFFGIKKENKPAETVANNTKTSASAEVTFEKGDVVSVLGETYYGSTKKIPDWVKSLKWIVKSVKGDRVVIDKSVDGKHSICSAVAAKDLKKV